MKKFFPGRNHISILPYLIALYFFATFIFPKSTSAAPSECAPLSLFAEPQACASGTTTCGFEVPIGRGGTMQPMCCPSANDCDLKQQTLSESGPLAREKVSVCTYAGDKSGECNSCLSSKGIWTALGCIPFNQDEFVVAVVKIIMGVAGLITLAMMLVATVMLMTGGGNSEQMKRGKEIFFGAVVGLLFLIFSVVIFQIITTDIIKLDITEPNARPVQPGGPVQPI